jgi:LemA protein
MNNAIAILVLAVVPLAGCGYNSAIAADEEVKKEWGNVENAYQRRADLIPNLVATVKGAAQHEEKVLEEVTQARASATQIKLSVEDLSDPAKMKAFEEAQRNVGQSLGRLLATSERYPEIRANANFRDLQTQIEGTENRIAVARNRYNEAVASYNKIVREFPSMIGARMAGLRPRQAFTATTAGAEKAPEVKF